MSSITYEASDKLLNVRLDKKIVGSIHKNPKNGLFYYKAKGASKCKGQEMASIEAVKRSIEG